MNIGLVIERYDLQRGGAERSAAQITAHLVERGHQVTIITWFARPDCGPTDAIIDAHGQDDSFGWLNRLRFVRWARHRLREASFDVSLSMTTAVATTVMQPRGGTIRAALAQNVSMRRGAARRCLKRLCLRLSPRHQLQLIHERKALTDPSVRRFVAISPFVQDQLERHYGIDSQQIEVIPNGSDMPRPSDEQRLLWRQNVRQAFQIGPDEPTYLFAAHNPQLKGIFTLLRAVDLLRRRDLTVTILAVGPLSYGVLREAARLQVRDRLRFVGTTDYMAALYCAADVTVLPTFYDPSSKVVIESLMMGVPAISTTNNGASDFIRANGKLSAAGRVLTSADDPSELADAMADLADPQARCRCQPNPELADQLSMRRHVDRLERLLLETVG